MGRSLLAIVAGYLFFTIVGRSASYALAYLMRGSGPGDGPAPAGAFAVQIAAGFAVALAAGHVCARVARGGGPAHAVLAGILAAIGLGLVVDPPAGVPQLRVLVEVATGVLGVLIGGFVRSRARAGSAPGP